jgi:hypothetical protein
MRLVSSSAAAAAVSIDAKSEIYARMEWRQTQDKIPYSGWFTLKERIAC